MFDLDIPHTESCGGCVLFSFSKFLRAATADGSPWFYDDNLRGRIGLGRMSKVTGQQDLVALLLYVT